VIIGKAYGHKLPIFEKEIKFVIFRPYQRTEIVPHGQKDRNYISMTDASGVTQIRPMRVT
jgi:hypothetical protein